MNYFYAEHIKWKRTITSKLVWITPVITILFAIFMGGFYSMQYLSFYWWYSFMVPGWIAILCTLAVKRELRTGNCNALCALPVNREKVEAATVVVIAVKLVIAACVLALLETINNIIAPPLAVYSFLKCLVGSLAIIVSVFWQIPLCLFASRTIGMGATIMGNVLMALFLPMFCGDTVLGWLIPYCWAGKIGEYMLGIAINGTFSKETSNAFKAVVLVLLAIGFWGCLMVADSRNFSKREGR